VITNVGISFNFFYKEKAMKTKCFFLITAIFSFLLNTSLSYIRPDSAQLSAWNSFKQAHAGNWSIRYDKKTGVPASIYMGKTKPYTGTPEKIARTFLKEIALLTKMKPDVSNLKLLHILSHGNINDVTFQETYNNIPIEGAEYQVHIQSDGGIDMVNGTYYPSVEVQTTPQMTGDAALTIAKNDVGKNVVVRGIPSSDLAVYPDSNRFLLAWKIFVGTEKPYGDWIYFVDAIEGKIITKCNNIFKITGCGNVYPTNPNISSVTNVPLNNLDGSGYLRGQYSDVLNDVTSRAYSSNETFNYQTNNTHFDEVNVYQHINSIGDYFAAIDAGAYGRMGTQPITTRVHYQEDPNNSGFVLSTGQLYFGDGTPSEGYYDFAEEDKIIYHEYTHAVVYSIVYLPEYLYVDPEPGGICEAIPDYFSGSYSERPVIGDYAFPSQSRDMINPGYSSYAALTSVPAYPWIGPYFTSELWSATLWDVRNNSSIGQTVADKLVYYGLFRITSNATFLSYAEAMIAEDIDRYGGAHVAAIQNCLMSRGIFYTGTLTLNTTWSGIVNVTGTVTVPAGVTLAIDACKFDGYGYYPFTIGGENFFQSTNVNFAYGASLIVNGKLLITGRSNQPITFNGGSIFFNGTGTAGSNISYVNMSNGATIQANSASNITIDHLNLQYGNVQALNSSNITVQNSNFTEGSITFTNSTGTVTGNVMAQDYATAILAQNGSTVNCYYNTIFGKNEALGEMGVIYCNGASGNIGQNDIDFFDYGINIFNSSSPHFHNPQSGSKNNRITGHLYSGISINNNSWPVIGYNGADCYGLNSIHDNLPYDIVLNNWGEGSPGYVDALGTYWNNGSWQNARVYVQPGSQLDYGQYGGFEVPNDPWGSTPLPSMQTQQGVPVPSGKGQIVASVASVPGANQSLNIAETSRQASAQKAINDSAADDPLSGGIQLRDNGNFKAAKDFFVSYLGKNPDDQRAYVELYNCADSTTTPSLIRYFKSLPQQADKEQRILLSYLYLKQGDIKSAKEVNNSIITANANTAFAMRATLNNFYITLYDDNDLQTASAILKDVLNKRDLSPQTSTRQVGSSTNPIELTLAQNALKTYVNPNIGGTPSSSTEQGSNEAVAVVPATNGLIENYPNPFNPTTVIRYQLSRDSRVTLKVYDILGREVATLVNDNQTAGVHEATFDATRHSSGVYFYRLSLPGHSYVKKMLLVK